MYDCLPKLSECMIQTSHFQKQLYIGNKPQTCNCTILKRWGKLVNVGHLLLMEEILHHLRLVVYPIIHRVFLYIFQVVLWDFWTINSIQRKKTTINKGESFRDKKIPGLLGNKSWSQRHINSIRTRPCKGLRVSKDVISCCNPPGGGEVEGKNTY